MRRSSSPTTSLAILTAALVWTSACEPNTAAHGRPGGLQTAASGLAEEPDDRLDLRGFLPPAPSTRALHAKAESRVQDLVRAQAQTPSEVDALAASIGADLNADGLLLQIDLAPGRLASQLSDTWLAQRGARVIVRGRDVLDVRVPLDRVLGLADASDLIAWLRFPLRPVASLGKKQSQGVLASWAESWHCTGLRGKGADVAVLDSGFKAVAQAKAAGELPAGLKIHPGPSDPDSTHGTACLEIVADMAPEATLHAVPTYTLAMLQDFAFNKLPGSPIDVISHSMGWFGTGFGRNDGKLCRLVEHVRAQGVAWLGSAGNAGHMRMWRGTFADEDGKGWHAFAPGEVHNRTLFVPGQTFRLILDWDEYPNATTDLDLYLCRLAGGKCEPIAQSTNLQNGTQSPYEAVVGHVAKAGLYGVAIHRKAGSAAPMMRLYMLDGIGLMKFHKDHTVSAPASCTAATAVAALAWDQYDTGPVEDYSSQGPTEDGRVKPDIAAPTSVATQVSGSFSGTSASAPHAAAAVALYMSATPMVALEALQHTLDDAVPMGQGAPNNQYGFGRLHLDPLLSGATCHPAQQLACTTACGSQGTQSCAPGCQTATCTPPPEVCNAADDDCDGQTDENQTCVPGQTEACATACETAGLRTCSANCGWGECAPVPVDETCDGIDNDCDGQTDEGFTCVPGSRQDCQTDCATLGERRCSSKCGWGVCKPPEEICNALDDDCDGQTDESFDCTPGARGACQTTCGSSGTRSCDDGCGWQVCEPPTEQCNGRDDDCDGAVDEGLSCGGCSAAPSLSPGSPAPWVPWSLVLGALLLVWRRAGRRRAGDA